MRESIMKKSENKRARRALLPLLLTFVLATGLLTGCGSDTSSKGFQTTNGASSPSGDSSPQESYDSESALYGDGEISGDVSAASRPYGDNVKLILRAELTLETTDFQSSADQLVKLTADCGGYFEQSNVDMGSYYSDGYRCGYYTVRVPRDKYDAFLNAVGDVCHVTSRNESAEDIGLQYYDLESRIRLLEIKQERLMNLLKQASSMDDIISLENALSEIQYQLEANNSEKNRYDSLISYSTIEIRLDQVQRLSGEPMEQQGFGSQMGTALSEGFLNTVDGFANILLLIAYNIIPLTIFAAILIAFLWFSAKRRRNPSAASTAHNAPKRQWFNRKNKSAGVETRWERTNPPQNNQTRQGSQNPQSGQNPKSGQSQRAQQNAQGGPSAQRETVKPDVQNESNAQNTANAADKQNESSPK